MIKLERTRDRHLQHLWVGLAYIGAVEHGTIVLVPYLEAHKDRILADLPRNLRGRAVKVGIPGERYLPLKEAEEAKPIAKKRAKVTQTTNE